jgi:Protein of Unknown function (DUF2784)
LLQAAKPLNIKDNYIYMMLQALDILFFVIHCFVIGFNLTGWIWTRTRRWHLVFVGLTVFSWLAMGIWYGLGYCALTDWHWQVKRALGEADLPNSFLTYLFNDVMGLGLETGFINWGAGIILTVVIFWSVALNFRDYWQYRLSRNLPEPNE